MGSPQLTSKKITSLDVIITADDVECYRRALGVDGDHVPLGLVMRTLRDEAVMSTLSDVLQDRHPIHLTQDYKVFRRLGVGIRYVCDVRLQFSSDDRFRMEQSLRDASGQLCLTLASEIMLVAP